MSTTAPPVDRTTTPTPDAARPEHGRIVVLSGNPRPASRTLDAARRLAARLSHDDVEPLVIDLADHAGALHHPPGPAVADALSAVRDAAVLVVATPVYKASLTGLLKSFLDLLPSAGLRGVLAVPVVVAGSPAHHHVADHHLRPILLDLAATTPTSSFVVTEEQLPDLDTLLEDWAALHRPTVDALVAPVEGVLR